LRWTEPNDATPFLPERRTLTSLREAAAGCRGCELWRNATQTVFGEGLNARG
jgi:DNA polymerase